MLDKTEGIVIKTVRYSESSMVITIFTQKHGLLSFMVQGVRSSKNKQKGNMLQPMNILALDIYLKENRNLNRIKEHSAAYIYKNIPLDFVKQSIGVFCIELISKCVKEQEINERLYSYLSAFLIELDTTIESIENKPLFFLLETAGILGFEPSVQNILLGSYFNMESGRFENSISSTQNSLSIDETNLFKKMLAMYYDKNELKLTSSERKVLLEKLLIYFRWHVADFSDLKSPAVLSEVLR